MALWEGGLDNRREKGVALWEGGLDDGKKRDWGFRYWGGEGVAL